MSRAAEIRRTLQQVSELDRQWMGKVPGAGDARHTPWMPFPVPEFITLLAAAVTEADGDAFLEIGAGIGTKMLVAKTLFGLGVAGVERVPEYVAQAAEMGITVLEADILDFADYAPFDIIWFNRAFRDASAQTQLEHQVWDGVRPGAVVMCANLENKPPSNWFIVDDEWGDLRRGVWQKPLTA